ncbi:hypothetical protein ACFQE8_10645 [Salinirubellus sp. GCM10025818]|uniref:COG1470 family protein n=1 Tax=Salinirubellus sp. GCM10025818 TaxID=3252688 RepID=UPI0036111D15
MTITNHGEESRDRTGHDGTGCGRPRRTFLKGVGLLGAGAVFGPSLASPVGATPESSIPSLAAALDTPALGTEFEVTYGGGGEDRFSDVVQASDGGYVLTGITRSPRGDRRGLVVKTDDEGAIEWEWVDTDRNPSILRTVVELDDGYIFGGQANGTSLVTYRYWLLKTDFDGNVLWERTYGVPGYYANARAAIPTADGGFAIAGEAAPSGKGIDFYLVKTDGNGDQEWARSYGSSGYESAEALLQTADGGFLLGGRANDQYLVRTDADGNEQWRKRFRRSGIQRITALAAASDGYLLAGWTTHETAGGEDVYLVKTDFDGNVLWERTYGGTGDDRALGLTTTADGGFVLVGETRSFGAGSRDGYLVKVDADGTEQLTATFGGVNDDTFKRVVETSDSGYAVVGQTRSAGGGDFDAWLVKTEPVSSGPSPPDSIPFTATVECDTARPARVTVTNVSDVTYELRDIDSAGIDALTGRPLLEPGETYTMDHLPNGVAVFRAFEPGTNTPIGPRRRVEIDCPQPLEVAVRGRRIDITNGGGRTVQVRDLDARGGNLLTGRPRLDPGEVLTKRGVAPDSYYVQAWDGGENARLAPPIEVVVEDDEAFFDVEYVATGSSTNAGDEYRIDVGITNTGTEPGMRRVELRFDDEVVATRELELDASASTGIRFVLPGERTIEFEPNRSYTVTADTGDDTGSTEKYVL